MPKGDKYKLKADPDDGTTPIANLLLEAVAMAKISGLQKGAILYLWRRTYGWTNDKGNRKKEDKIPLSEWREALDSTTPRVSATLSELEHKGIVKRRMADTWGGYYYSLNTDISKWNSNCLNIPLLCKSVGIANIETITENITVTENNTIPQMDNSPTLDNSSPKKNGTVTENVTVLLPKTEQCTLYKEILNKDKEIYSRLFKYWNSKGVVVHRKETATMDRRIKKALENYSEEEIKKAIDNYTIVMTHPDTYFFSFKWALEDFMSSGLRKFMDNVTPLTNYLAYKKVSVLEIPSNDPNKFTQGRYGGTVQK
jgi:DNA-binding transcriptional regulator GbsR (MarR family)